MNATKKLIFIAALAASVLTGAACEPTPKPTCDRTGTTCLIPPITIHHP